MAIHNGERGRKCRDEHDCGAPNKGEADRRPCRVEDAKVEEEPTDGGDDEEGGDRKALETERGDTAVDGTAGWVVGCQAAADAIEAVAASSIIDR